MPDAPPRPPGTLPPGTLPPPGSPPAPGTPPFGHAASATTATAVISLECRSMAAPSPVEPHGYQKLAGCVRPRDTKRAGDRPARDRSDAASSNDSLRL